MWNLLFLLLVTIQYIQCYWQPTPNIHNWQFQLTGTVDTDNIVAPIYVLDLFNTTNTTIQALHSKNVIVTCYFSAGAYQSWLPDAAYFDPLRLSSVMTGTDNIWIDISAYNVQSNYSNYTIAQVMENRIQYASQLGCDGISPDYVDASEYDILTVSGVNATGYRVYGSAITQAQQVAYDTFLANTAHTYNLSIEGCVEFNSCDQEQPFLSADKLILDVEYNVTNTTATCQYTNTNNINTIIKLDGLDGTVVECQAASNATAMCGDGVCLGSENASSCPADCAAAAAPTSVTSTSTAGDPLSGALGNGAASSTAGTTAPNSDALGSLFGTTAPASTVSSSVPTTANTNTKTSAGHTAAAAATLTTVLSVIPLMV